MMNVFIAKKLAVYYKYDVKILEKHNFLTRFIK